ncbi:tetratricopeptide repeat protein [Planctomycetota bacterium]
MIIVALALSLWGLWGLRNFRRTYRTDQAKEMGNLAFDEGRWEEAASELGRYILGKKSIVEIEVLLKYAQAQLNRRPIKREYVDQATARYRDVLRLDRGNLEASKELISLYLLYWGAPGEAENVARKILEVNQDPKIHTFLALALKQQRKFKDAYDVLENIIENYPEHIPAYQELGLLLSERKNEFPDSSAEDWYNEAVKDNPDSAQAYLVRASFYLGQQNITQENITQAQADIQQAEKLQPTDVKTLLLLSKWFINTNELEKAQKYLAQTQKLEPSNGGLWQLWADLARRVNDKTIMVQVAEDGLKELALHRWDFMPTTIDLLILAGELDQAAGYIDQLRQKEINLAQLEYFEGLIASQKNQIYQALEHWNKALQMGYKKSPLKSDLRPDLRYTLAVALSTIGDNQTALQHLRSLVSEQPQNAQAALNYGKMLFQTGNWAEAAEQAQIAARLAPENREAAKFRVQTQMQLLRVDENLPQWQAVEKQLDALAEGATDDALEIKMWQLQLVFGQRQFDWAQQLIQDMKKDHASNPQVALREVDLLLAKQEIDQAIAKLQENIQVFPESPLPVKALAALLVREDKIEEGVNVIRSAIERIETPAVQRDLSISLAALLVQQGKNEEGARVIHSAIEQAQEPMVQRSLGLILEEIYRAGGDLDQAVETLAGLATKFPRDILIKRQLLNYQQIAKNQSQAQKLVDEIKKLEGDQGWQWRYEQARLWLGLAAEDFEFYTQAVSLLKENLRNNPSDQPSRLLLGGVYQRKGELWLAVSTFREAYNQSPKNLAVIIPTVAALNQAREFDEATEILNRAAREKLSHPTLSGLQFDAYLGQGELESGIDILENLMQNDPENRETRLLLASLKSQQGKYAEAENLLNDLKTDYPDDLSITQAQIALNINRGSTEEAIKLCNQLVKTLNDSAAFLMRARTYTLLGQSLQAEQDYEQAQALAPDDTNVLIIISEFYRSQGQIDKAVIAVQKALSLEPDNLQIQKKAISLFPLSGDPDVVRQGQSLFQNAFKSYPDDIDLRTHQARILLSTPIRPNIEQARNILQEITKNRPEIVEPWLLLAQRALLDNQPQIALDLTSSGLNAVHDNRDLLQLKALSEMAISPASAITTLEKLRQLYPDDINLLLSLADVLSTSGDSEKAAKLLKEELASREDQIERRNLSIYIAVAKHYNGLKEEALNELDVLFETAPDDLSAPITQARLLKNDQQWAELKRKTALWYESCPQGADLLAAIGNDLMASGDPDAMKTAEDIYRWLLTKEPNHLLVLKNLAIYLQSIGRSAESVPLYQKIITLKPDDVMTLNNLAWALCEDQNNYQEALQLAQQGLKINPQYIDLIDTRGVVYYRMGEYDKAIQDFTKCVEWYPQQARSLAASYFHLGRAQAKINRKVEAVQNLKKALDLHDKNQGLSNEDFMEADRLHKELSKGV